MKRTFQNIARNLNSNDCKDEIEDNYLPFSVPKHYKISFFKLIDMFAFFQSDFSNKWHKKHSNDSPTSKKIEIQDSLAGGDFCCRFKANEMMSQLKS